MKSIRILSAAILMLMVGCTSAPAQQVPLQGGPWVAGRAPMYSQSGGTQPVIQDSGPASGGQPGIGMAEGLYVARGTGTAPYADQGTGPLGTNWCDYDAPITNADGYHFLCMSANAQNGGLIAYGNGGGAAELPLHFSVNGELFDFPGSGGTERGPLNIVTYGGDPSDVEDSSPAFAAALAACPTQGCAIYFPRGKYKMLSSESFTFPDTTSGITIYGDGPDATILDYRSSSGMLFTYTAIQNSVTIARMTMTTTDTLGGGKAISVTQPDDANCLGVISPTTIQDVVMRGASNSGGGSTEYWGTGFYVDGVSNTRLNNVTIWGGVGTGTGAFYTGRDTPVCFSNAHLVSQSYFHNNNLGVVIGTHVQGMSILQSDFITNSFGVSVPTGSIGLAGLMISESQFGGSSNQIDIESAFEGVSIVNNYMGTVGAATNIKVFSPQGCTISSNYITSGSANTDIGVVISRGGAGLTPCSIVGNNFTNMLTAVSLGATSTRNVVSDNAYDNNTNKVVDSGTWNEGSDVITAFTPTFTITGGSSTSATSTDAFVERVGNMIFVEYRGVINYVGTPTTIAVALPNSLVGVAGQIQTISGWNASTGLIVGELAAASNTLTLLTTTATLPVNSTGQAIYVSGWLHIQ